MRIGICGNYNLNLLANIIDTTIPDCDIIVGDESKFLEELKNAAGDFRSVDFCIIALNWNLYLDFLSDYGFNDNFSEKKNQIKNQFNILNTAILQFRSICNAPILIFSPLIEKKSPMGFISRLVENSYLDLLSDCQFQFNSFCKSFPDFYPVDIEEICFDIGFENLFTYTDEFLVYSNLFLKRIADYINDIIIQIKIYPLKCVVLDLDNTLWGGIVGESGIQSIKLGNDGIGKAFKDFQREIVRLYKQGIIIAICSKNNTCDALEVFEDHPHMLLRPSMISCFRINWEDKPRNILSIAKELNIGLDSIVFIDDSQSEREMVKKALPDIEILDLPDNPIFYAKAIKEYHRFWPVQLTKDDLVKRSFFSLDKLRQSSLEMSNNISDFLINSQIKISIKKADNNALPRITQLFNKTNQFNLTTIRYTQFQLQNFLNLSDTHIFYLQMSDIYGDYGIISVALLRNNTIDSFLLSCRAFGKKVENAFLSYLLQYARNTELKEVFGIYRPTHKNVMTKDFYKDAEFSLLEETAEQTIWKFDLSKKIIPTPKWFTFENI